MTVTPISLDWREQGTTAHPRWGASHEARTGVPSARLTRAYRLWWTLIDECVADLSAGVDSEGTADWRSASDEEDR